MNADGTAGIENDIKGEILESQAFGTFRVYHIRKHCPYCPEAQQGIQPVLHLVISKGLNSVSYHCNVCYVQYYYLKHETYLYVSEGELTNHPSYTPRPKQESYQLHYNEARCSRWFENQNLDNIAIESGIWTMATEVCAQLFHKKMSGRSPGYFMGISLAEEREEKITSEHAEKFEQALSWLKTRDYI